MRVPWTERRSEQSILKEISLGCSLEGMMLKLKLQYFVGSHSARENLELIPPGKEPNFRPLQPSDREVLLAGLDAVLPEEWLEKIWQMIWNRWCEYEDFRDSRR